MNPENNRFIFAMTILIIIAVFGGLIITHRVNEQTSYGLHEIIGILAVLGGAVVNSWLGSGVASVASIFKSPTGSPEEVKKL